MRKPRIALPEINQNVTNYTAALNAAGMEPVVVSVHAEHLLETSQQEYLDFSEFRADACDGLLLPGGYDIDPGRYGEENCGCMTIIPELDRLQFDVFDAFVKLKKPVFGVCRGMQLINIYFGGNMIQHLSNAFRHCPDADLKDKVHSGTTQADSWLFGLYGKSFPHNSAHHQGIKRLGRGLEIDEWCSEDGTVEAVHHVSLPVFGVQWHPERMCLQKARPDTVDGLAVFQFFCGICRDAAPALPEGDGEMMYERMGL